jgi:TolA-binding protein
LDREDELGEIKKEILESRGLVIRTNNLTNALAADLKSIAKRQEDYERRISWNSATAYVAFVVVVLVCLKFAWDARVDQVRAEMEGKSSELERLRREQRELGKRDEDRARAETRAAVAYELVRQNKRVELVETWETLRKEPLSKAEALFFGDAADRARSELATILYLQGLDRMRLQRFQEAATSFEESARYKDDSSVAPQVRLGMASAYRKLGRQKDAIPILEKLAESSVDKELQDDAVYELGHCQMELSAWNDAKNTWRTLLRRFPDSRFGPEAKMLLAQLMLNH